MEGGLVVQGCAAAAPAGQPVAAVASQRSGQDASRLTLDNVQDILRHASQAGEAAAAASRELTQEQRKRAEAEQELEDKVKASLTWSQDFDKQWLDFKKKFDDLFALGAQKWGESVASLKQQRPGELVDEARVAQVLRRAARLVVLTGAGVSAESGIPTFRGADGYWTVGSENYRPQELATWQKFDEMPEELWRWYQYRWGICRKASINPGHSALVDLEGLAEGEYLLVTQNIDGLHRKAGSDEARLCEIHGRIDQMRCDERVEGACLHGLDLDDSANFELVRATIQTTPEPAKEEHAEVLPRCPRCGVRQRPRILWFDECYNEAIYRSKTAYQAAQACDVLLIIGTQLTTGMPSRMVAAARSSGATIVRMDPEFDAEESGGMLHLQAKSGEALPRIVSLLRELRREPLLAPLATVPGHTGPVAKAAPTVGMRRSPSRASVKAAPKPAPKAAPRQQSPARASSSSRAAPLARRSPSNGPGGGSTLRAAGGAISQGGAVANQQVPPRAGSPAAQARAAASGPAVGFFVYGTLRPDDDSGAAWTKAFCEGMRSEAAMLPGASLYFSGSYPEVCFEQTRCSVRGMLLMPESVDAAASVMEAKLVEADRIEGYPDLYDRTVAAVQTSSGARLAYVYHRTGRFERSVGDRIADGDWLSRRR